MFHVHHHHDEKTCPAHNAEAVGASFGAVLPALAEYGVNGVGVSPSSGGGEYLAGGIGAGVLTGSTCLVHF